MQGLASLASLVFNRQVVQHRDDACQQSCRSQMGGPARFGQNILLLMFVIYFIYICLVSFASVCLCMCRCNCSRDCGVSVRSLTCNTHSFPLLLSTASLSFLITSPGSVAPKTALPATMTLAPASAAWSMVFSDKPPSTSICRSGYFFRSAETLGSSDAMKDWPPKPGSTVMTRTI
jgi:hypothetical protein